MTLSYSACGTYLGWWHVAGGSLVQFPHHLVVALRLHQSQVVEPGVIVVRVSLNLLKYINIIKLCHGSSTRHIHLRVYTQAISLLPCCGIYIHVAHF